MQLIEPKFKTFFFFRLYKKAYRQLVKFSIFRRTHDKTFTIYDNKKHLGFKINNKTNKNQIKNEVNEVVYTKTYAKNIDSGKATAGSVPLIQIGFQEQLFKQN